MLLEVVQQKFVCMCFRHTVKCSTHTQKPNTNVGFRNSTKPLLLLEWYEWYCYFFKLRFCFCRAITLQSFSLQLCQHVWCLALVCRFVFHALCGISCIFKNLHANRWRNYSTYWCTVEKYLQCASGEWNVTSGFTFGQIRLFFNVRHSSSFHGHESMYCFIFIVVPWLSRSIHLRPRLFETTFIIDVFIWDHVLLRPVHSRSHSHGTFIWDHINFTPC